MSQYQENATVTRVERFSERNYRVTVHSPQVSAAALPGQFVMIKAGLGKDPLLRRPFSIHQTTSEGDLQLYFKVVGRGTDILSRVKKDEVISVFGPLGRGYRLDENSPSVFLGGGLGIAPLLFLAKENCRIKKHCGQDLLILGGREKSELEPLLTDFNEFGLSTFTSTDDGSLGHKGNAVEILETIDLPEHCTVYACGPEPMLAAASGFCKKNTIPCQVSVESVMACGMGACLGCSRPAKNGTYTHVCLNGPVYDAEKLVWNI
jgi:dihydroorotate dehydrogenase electron transfer subunit